MGRMPNTKEKEFKKLQKNIRIFIFTKVEMS